MWNNNKNRKEHGIGYFTFGKAVGIVKGADVTRLEYIVT